MKNLVCSHLNKRKICTNIFFANHQKIPFKYGGFCIIASMKTTFTLIFSTLLILTGKAQSWQQLKDIPVDLTYPVVVELNGNIHMVGGGATGGATDIHLRYSPSLDKWDTMAPVPYMAQQPAGAVVKGKLHFCGGGFPNSGTPLNKHYVYDPDSNKWSQAANLPVATAIHQAVGFDDKLYVLTGQPNKQLCEYYDPSTNTWTQKQSLPDMNFWYSAVLANKNSIFRFGGGGYLSPQKAAYQYDKDNDVWNALPDMPLALHGLDACFINDSLIYLVGGYNGLNKNYMWIYNVNSKKYSVTKSLTLARSYHSAISIDNCLYVVGGNNNAQPEMGTLIEKLCPGPKPLSIAALTNTPYTMVNTPDHLSFEFAESPASTATLSVIDMSGKTVYTETTDARHIKLDARHFASSIYTVQVHYQGNTYNEKWMPLR
jgi:N-acetylneuraminic acid mutarotase